MVHRPPDSRLLTNLISHEKDYAKHLAAVFPLSHSALASLSAYAAASPSSHNASPAPVIAAIVDVLASADDALQRYTHALDTWRDQLVALKDLEDDLAAVLRDRDILVTRLIKASKSTRDTHRSSRLVAPLSNLGSASFASLPSTNSTTFSTTGPSPASSNAKLAQAQAELQACEAHLVAKESELDARRVTVARDGLGARCRALIDCGWVWGEMGKQGLMALQVLTADGSASGSSHAEAPKQSLTISPRNPTTYTSDHSSVTPSQSASQTASHSVETSHEGPRPKEYGREHIQPESSTKAQSRLSRTREDTNADLTITLPPAHAIAELTVPASVCARNGDSTGVTDAGTSIGAKRLEPAPGWKRTKRARRPPSQHIPEVPDEEGPDGDPSAPHNSKIHTGATDINTLATSTANMNSRTPQTPFPTTRATDTADTSSDDEPRGVLQVVENDPFEVIRRSMLGSSAGVGAGQRTSFLAATTPVARASAPDVRVSAVEASPTGVAFPGLASSPGGGMDGMNIDLGVGSSPGSSSSTKRQRRTSLAIFGSLRGLFRKPRERERLAVTEWDEGLSLPIVGVSRTSGGWVTRTDARIRKKGGEDSNGEATTATTAKGTVTGTVTTTNVVRNASGARLRKRPGVSAQRTGVDGWVTDSPGANIDAGAGPGASASKTGTGTATGVGRSRTRRGTMKRKKLSVADLRGSDHGHTDGEVDGRRSMEASKGSLRLSKGPEASGSKSKPVFEIEQKKVPGASTDAQTPANPSVEPGASFMTDATANPTRRVTTTATSSRKTSSDVAPAHRRSASLSLVDTHVTIASQGTARHKPTPEVESSVIPSPSAPVSQDPGLSLAQVRTQVQTQTQPPPPHSTSKHHARRQLGNGHAKHAQSPSLMSIVADVTRQSLDQDHCRGREREWRVDKARSLDVPRAPESVLRVDRHREGEAEVGVERTLVNGRAHMKARSEDVGWAQGQRAIKMPLKSALRNASRTPSPSPADAVFRVQETGREGGAREGKGKEQPEEDRGRVVEPSLRDSASISSYATGKESLDGESLALSPPRSSSPDLSHSPPLTQSQPPALQAPLAVPHMVLGSTRGTPSPPPPTLLFTFPPPPLDPPPARGRTGASKASTSANAISIMNPSPVPVSVLNAHASANAYPHSHVGEVEPPSSTVSTETPPVQRRKSVRVSLQPTFSPAPPALWDDDGDYAPWDSDGEREKGKGGRTRGGKSTKEREREMDVWADSSDEDEAYSHARRLLNMVGRGK